MNNIWYFTVKRFLFSAGFIALVSFCLVFLAGYSYAQVESVECIPTQEIDTDGDGFSDEEEINGFTLLNGDIYQTDPLQPDAFIEIDRAGNNTLLNENIDLLAYLREGGLGINFHELPEGVSDDERIILQRPDGTCQKAVLIFEDRTYVGDCNVVLGRTQQGPPNNAKGPVFLYTDRIECFVGEENKCDTQNNCTVASTGVSDVAGIIQQLVLNTIAHEAGHRYTLGPVYNRRHGGWHFKEGEGVMMEQSSKVTSRKSGVTFYISSKFSDLSAAKTVLK